MTTSVSASTASSLDPLNNLNAMVSVLPHSSFVKPIPEAIPELLETTTTTTTTTDNATVAETCDTKEETPASEAQVVENQPQASTVNNNPAVSKHREAGKYVMKRTIGKGNFAKVKLAIHIATGQEVAIKIIQKTQMKPQLLSRLKREIDIMKLTKHPNIVKLLEIIETDDVLCLVMEYANGGEIFDYLVANGKMRENEARVKFRQLVSAIHYCHCKKIVHRDLKAENILLDGRLDVKVADFGLANMFERDGHLKTFCGSPPYAAPELFLGVPYYGPCVDIWSLGVILFTIVVGHLPFEAKDIRELKAKVIGLNYNFPRNSVSAEFKSIVGKMLILDPRRRSTLRSIMDHAWINIGFENDPLRPYEEQRASELDDVRVQAMKSMDYTLQDLENSVVRPKFDHTYATYNLLACDPNAQTPEPAAPGNLLISQSPTIEEEAEAKPKGSTVGRFTVESTTAAAVTSSESAKAQQGGVDTSTFDPHHRLSNEAASTTEKLQTPIPHDKQHHSFTTSSMPTAWRKAIMHMGRTLGNTLASENNSVAVEGTSCNTATAPQRDHSLHSKNLNATQPTKRNPKNYMLSMTAAPMPMLHNQKGAVPKAVGAQQPQASVGCVDPLQTSRECPSPGGNSNNLAARRASFQPAFVTPVNSCGAGVHTGGLLPTNPATPVVSPMASTTSFNNHGGSVNKGSGVPSAMAPPSSTTTWHSGNSRMLNLLQRQFQNLSSSSSHGSHSPTMSSGKTTPSRHSCLTLAQQQEETMKSTVATAATRARMTPVSSAGALLNLANSSGNASHSTGRFQVTKTAEAAGTVPTLGLENAANTGLGHHHMDALDSPVGIHNSNSTGNTTNSLSLLKLLKLKGIFHQNSTSKSGGPWCKRPNNNSKPSEKVFPWGMNSTSTKSAKAILEEAKVGLSRVPGVRWVVDHQNAYIIHCTWHGDRLSVQDAKLKWQNEKSAASSSTPCLLNSWEAENMCTLNEDDPISWEMEVCKLQQTTLYGIRLNRIRGPAIEYKKIARQVMKAMDL